MAIAALIVPVLVISAVISFRQIYELRIAVVSGGDAALNNEFFNETNAGIVHALELDKPILIEHRGSFSDAQLDNYLNDFNDMDAAYHDGVLTENDLCLSYSYYVYISASNPEINSYISSQGSDFYEGLSDLNSVVSASKDKDCHD